MIPYGRQDISEEDIQSVINVLKSDFLTQGPVVPEFEKAVIDYCGVNFAFAVNSATSALHIACLSLDVGKGDIVWTSPISFVASSNCALYCGGIIDFVDIDPSTYNISVEKLKIKLVDAEINGNLPKVLIPVHLAGQSCQMEEIHKLSIIYGFKIIEDASHGIGGKYKNKPIGSCIYSDITIFSFHPVKIITTGEGGMCLTNNQGIAKKLNRLRSHGIVRHPSEMKKIPEGLWYYEQVELGYNYRMTDLQAALGLSQLKRIDQFVKRRHEIKQRYDIALQEKGIILPFQNEDTFSSFHLYILKIEEDAKIGNRNQVFERMRNAGVLVNVHYIPIYKHPYYTELGYSSVDYSNSEDYYSKAISLPIHTSLTIEQQDYVIDMIKKPAGFQNIF
jgi:UDP-4-amino-4,6-dideoxy-N-acetyl-beta-L-altrosamine transaminase